MIPYNNPNKFLYNNQYSQYILCKIQNMYQNKIIQRSMDNVLEKAVNYTDRKTCKALYGVVGLPSTPTVTVLEGADSCGCMRSAAAG